MIINGPSEITAKASLGRPDGGFLGLLHVVALTAVVAGAGGSLALMLRAGHPPFLLRVLFAIWVLSPFMPSYWGHGFKALVDFYQSDASYRDAGSSP